MDISSRIRCQIREKDCEFRDRGYQVLGAANGEEALQISERHSAPIDLLLTDVIMPFATGTEVEESLRQRYPESKVLYMSGYPADVIARIVGEYGGSGFEG